MSMAVSFPASQGRPIIDALIAAIDENAQLLSEIDGAIGDGDQVRRLPVEVLRGG